MQKSYSPKPHNRVDYYPLPNGYADVFLHRDEIEDVDEDKNVVYIADEVYFQVKQSVSKDDIEENFEYMWNDAIKDAGDLITIEQRLEALENAMLEIILGGDNA